MNGWIHVDYMIESYDTVGGAVTLPVVNNAAGGFLRDITITTTGGAGGSAGLLSLAGNITLDNNGATADFTYAGSQVAILNSLTIDSGWREVADTCLTWLHRQSL